MSAQSAPSAPQQEEQMTTKRWLGLFGVLIGAFMAILDIQITNASIRDVTGGLGSTIEDGSWISTAYLAAEIVIIPLSGWLAEVFSLKTYLLWTSALFLMFSVACGFATSLPTMIVFRALQGITGGALIPLAFQVILGLPRSKVTLGTTLFMVTATFAPAIGPTIGGYLTDMFHWPVIFYVNLVPGLLLMVLSYYGLENAEPKHHLLKNVDGWGILSMTIGLSSFTVFLEEGQKDDWFGSRIITSLAITAALCISAFIWIELKSLKPFVNLRLFARWNFGIGSLVNLVVGVALYGALYLLPLYLSTIQDYNSINIGKTMIWAGLPQLLVLPFIPKILPKVDARWMAVVGLMLFSASCFMNSGMDDQVGLEQLRWSQLVRAIGQPLVMVPLTIIATSLIEPAQAGSASGLFNMLRNLGGSIGIALLSTLYTVREQFHSVRIHERVTAFSIPMQIREWNLQHFFALNGSDAITAQYKTYGAVALAVRKQAAVMAFNDCFYVVAAALLAGSILVMFTRKVTMPAGGAAVH